MTSEMFIQLDAANICIKRPTIFQSHYMKLCCDHRVQNLTRIQASLSTSSEYNAKPNRHRDRSLVGVNWCGTIEIQSFQFTSAEDMPLIVCV